MDTQQEENFCKRFDLIECMSLCQRLYNLLEVISIHSYTVLDF